MYLKQFFKKKKIKLKRFCLGSNWLLAVPLPKNDVELHQHLRKLILHHYLLLCCNLTLPNHNMASNKGRIIFYEEGGGSKDFMGGPHFFPNLKRGGGYVFFQSLILNIFFKKKGMQYQKSECKLYY